MQTRLRRAAVALLAVAAVTVAACGSSGSQTASGQKFAKGGTFTVAIPADPGNLDPQQSVLSATGTVDSFLYDSLIYQNPDGKVVPELAEKWSVRPASVTYTLRKDVTCSDGTPLKASDVARNFEYIKDPKNASPLLGVNVPSSDFTVSADDGARTFTITMAQPFGFLLLGSGSVSIVCPKGMSDRGLLNHGSSGTGPFVMTDAVPSDHYTMKKRDGYRWGPNGNRSDAAGFPDTVTIKIIQNASTAANLLLSGGLNAAGANGPDRPRLEAAHLTKVASPVLLFELFYNEAPGHPGSDENVRRALTMALDLGQVGKVADGGLGQPATGLAVTPPRACPGDTVKGNLPRHDMNEAAALLDKAGWKKGAGGVREKDGKPMTMTLLQPSAEGDQVAAAVELVSQSWKKLGVDVSIKAATDTGLIDIIDKTGAWDAGQIPVNHYLPSVIQAFVSGPAPPQGNNVAHISNKGYDRLSAQALKTPGEAGCKLWNDAEKELFKHVDVVPVVNDLQPVYGQKATFSPGPYGFDPTSVRLLG